MPPALGVLGVVCCPNPLRPVADRQVRGIVLTGTDTIASIVQRLGLQGASLSASLNAAEVPRKRWGRKRVREGDALVLTQRMHGYETAILAAQKFGTVNAFTMVAAAALTFVTSELAIALAISVLANSLTSQRGGGPPRSQEAEAALAAHSIEGGSNSARSYGPLPLVLGECRVFPDYASRPFGEYVPDFTTTHRVINSTPEYANQLHVAWSFTEDFDPMSDLYDVTPAAPWTLITSEGATVGQNSYFGDNVGRTYTKPSGSATQPHTFVVRHTNGDDDGSEDRVTDYEDYLTGTPNWRPLGSALPVIIAYGYMATEHTEQLTSIFNYGLGDLVLSDHRIGSTPLANFNAWQMHHSTVPAGFPDRTTLVGYSSPGYGGTDYPDDAVVVDGGKLEQRDGVLNGGWVERKARPGRYVQIDIAGRLFNQVNGSIEQLACTIEAEYRAAGSGVWSPMAFSPTTLVNGTVTLHRRTLAQTFGFDVDAIRVRRTTPEPTDARQVSELECTRIKIFKPQAALYPAQRRLGLIIKATGQLNGRIDRFSSLAKARHWVWDSAAAWSGVLPGDGGPWVWTHTVNPAWLFLYYARGGFLSSVATAHLGLAGWLDRPHPANGPRMFGAGLVNERIDYAAIVAWGQWCDANSLQCRMVVDENLSAGEVLDAIAAAGRASKSWATGKLSVVWEGAGQPVVAAFGMANIVAGSFKIGYDTDSTVHEIALQYTRSDDDFQPDTVYAQVPGVPQVVNQRSEQAIYAMPRTQAQRLANLLAASRHYHRRKITWESHLEALSVQRGDVIHLAHDLTQWAFSGRLLELVAEGGAIVAVRLSCPVEDASAAGSFYLWIRRPSGSYVSVECTPPAERTDLVEVAGAWPVADAPGHLGGAADVENLASNWPDTSPVDWMFLAGPTATPGKRARITSMEPVSGYKVRLTARDEYEAYYPLEFGLEGAPEPASGEQLVARAFNLAIDPAPAGGHRLSWELQNAHGAEVMLAVDGGPPAQVPTHGVLSVLGTEVLLPAYPPGTTLSIELLPIAAGVPIAVQGDSLEVEV